MPTKFDCVSGVARNTILHRQVKNIVFSANMYSRPPGLVLRWKNTGHAMLSLLQPNDYVPKLSGDHVPVELNHVHVMPAHRQAGNGTILVRHCLDYARRMHWPVILRAIPYGNGSVKGPTANELVSWYTGLGFALIEKSNDICYMRFEHRD